jgi:hypothetical protein
MNSLAAWERVSPASDFFERDTKAETFRRLLQLTAVGYVAKLSGHGSVEDVISLDHLADGPSLILDAD